MFRQTFKHHFRNNFHLYRQTCIHESHDSLGKPEAVGSFLVENIEKESNGKRDFLPWSKSVFSVCPD